MTLKKFIHKEFIFLILLAVTLINPYYYGYRIAVVLSVILFFNLDLTGRLFDRNTIYLLLFGTIYHLLSANRTEILNNNLLPILPDMFLPAVMYLSGKQITFKYKSAVVAVFFLFMVMLLFTIVPMISVLEQVVIDGFSGVRSLYLLWNRDFLVSSTGLGAYFSINMASISVLSSPNQSKFQRRIRYLVVFIFLISIVCVFRLGNRTQLLISGVAFFISLLYNYHLLSLRKKILMLALFLIIIGYIFFLFSSESELIFFYLDRIGDKDYDFDSAGGRTEKWQLSLASILTDPWGWELSRHGYAHNLWLDVARVAGVMALLPLLLFTISSYFSFIKILQDKYVDRFLQTFILAFYFSIVSTFFVEPIMEGFYLFFLVYCLFVGTLNGIYLSKKISTY